MAERPPLYRLARVLRLLAILGIVLILIFVGLAIYSAARIRPSTSSGSPPSFVPIGNGTVAITANVSLSNPGYFPINEITIDGVTRLPDANGTLVARGASPPVGIAGGHTATVPVTFEVRLDATAGAILLTHDLKLPTEAWVNVTYASLFEVGLEVLQNLSWGAPFEALNVTPGTPVLQSNGTLAIPVTLSFSDHAKFPVTGVITFDVSSPSGMSCASGSFGFDVPASDSYRATQTVFASTGCNPHGGSIGLTFRGSPWTIVLPREGFP